MASKLIRGNLLAVALTLFGALVILVGAIDAYRFHRFESARQELQALMAKSVKATASGAPEQRAIESRFEIVDSSSMAVEIDSLPRDAVPEDEIPRPRLTVDAILPSDLYVTVRADADGAASGGSGTRDDPWRGLQYAIEQLQPGSRLIVLNGAYNGPFRIAAQAVDGKVDAPITILFASNATLEGSKPGEDCDSPVLEVSRNHWILEGLTLSPQSCVTGLRVSDRVSSISIHSPHIWGGKGDGIVVDAGAAGVSITNPHLHHLGTLEGKDKEWKRASREKQQTAQPYFSAIKARMSALSLTGGKIHNINGLAIRLTREDGSPVARPAMQEFYAKSGISIIEGQAIWW